jgi:vacuolar iron transporter family protein
MITEYLPELVYGANDGIVTTLAIVAGVFCAQLSSQVVLILGFANLLADGISMGASNVLSERSNRRRTGRDCGPHHATGSSSRC